MEGSTSTIKVVSAGNTQISDFVYQLAKAFLPSGANIRCQGELLWEGTAPTFLDNNISLFHTQLLWHYEIIYFSFNHIILWTILFMIFPYFSTWLIETIVNRFLPYVSPKKGLATSKLAGKP